MSRSEEFLQMRCNYNTLKPDVEFPIIDIDTMWVLYWRSGRAVAGQRQRCECSNKTGHKGKHSGEVCGPPGSRATSRTTLIYKPLSIIHGVIRSCPHYLFRRNKYSQSAERGKFDVITTVFGQKPISRCFCFVHLVWLWSPL